MKASRWFNRNRLSSLVRTASAVTLMSAAAATAFVAVKPVGPFLLGGSGIKHPSNKLRQDPDGSFGNRQAMPGAERDGIPTAAAEEEYANRAYPAAYIPLQLTANAQQAWANIAAATGNKSTSTGAWKLIGPSAANFPDVLTFSGASYTASGRITALAISPDCNRDSCRVWVAAAGGGIWRTDNALRKNSLNWTFISGSFATNAIGALTYDAASNTLYAGTGEANASADSEAGFGIYKSTDGGDTWTHLAAETSVDPADVDCDKANGVPHGTFGIRTAPAYSGPAFDGRAISSIVIDGSTLYVGSTRGVRGISSVLSGGVVSLAPGLPPFGLWKSTDGGANFALVNAEAICLNATLANDAGIIQSSFGSTRGVNRIALDPSNSRTVYLATFPRTAGVPRLTGGGVWRSNDRGANWRQIKAALNTATANDRPEFAVTPLASGATRMYVGEGTDLDSGIGQARIFRSDDVATGTPAFTDLTTTETLGYCTAQCWYDNVVYSPPGKPDVVYVGGSYSYATYGFSTNGRSFLRSADAGGSFTDMTWDATTKPTPPESCCQPNPIAPNGMHPDSHAIVEAPGTDIALFGSDGGLVRSSGEFADISSQCTDRGLIDPDLSVCQQLLSSVPTLIAGLNNGLSTLQFQSLSVSADEIGKHSLLQGGTQDNGTFQSRSTTVWPQIIYGDGGQSGFSRTNSSMRFNSFFSHFHDVNFQNGDPLKWVVASAPIVNSGETTQFYAPIIADPSTASAGTIFEGSQSVWRTQDWAGDQATLEANCPEFTTPSTQDGCGDFVAIGPAGATNLTTSATDYRGTTLAGGNVGALARTDSDTATLWAATSLGRVFISKNADSAASDVTYTRLDTLAANAPNRFISGISVDPADPNHAWISYSSYNLLTPLTPGHVFSVTYNPGGGTATWTNLDGTGATGFPDFPATGIAHDTNGDLYVSNDWGVLRLPDGSSDWEVAGSGLPNVEVAGITINSTTRELYAATHGRSAWVMNLR
jgi:hypothetical protein